MSNYRIEVVLYDESGESYLEILTPEKLVEMMGGERIQWCRVHDSNWLAASPVHEGCGWASWHMPCEKEDGYRWLVKDTRE